MAKGVCVEKKWEEFPISFVMNELCAPSYKKGRETPTGKGEMEIYCPYREGKTFEVNIRKNCWNCFRKCVDCPCGGSGDELSLYMLFFGGDVVNAYRQVSSAFNGERISPDRKRNMADSLPPLKTVERADPDKLNLVYTALLDVLDLSLKHLKHLRSRGLSDRDIEAMKFRSLPIVGGDTIAQTLSLAGITDFEGVPGFYKKDDGHFALIDFYNLSGILIPYRDREGRIVGLQIRRDVEINREMNEKEIKKAKRRRYRWLTSSGENMGTPAKNVPFWGIPGMENKTLVYATEGGLKAAVASSLSGRKFVAIPGVTCFSAWEELLTGLKEMGVRTLVDAFDSDRTTNRNVNDAIKNLYTIARSHGFEMKRLDWGTEFKGIDDFLLDKRERAVKAKRKAMKEKMRGPRVC